MSKKRKPKPHRRLSLPEYISKLEIRGPLTGAAWLVGIGGLIAAWILGVPRLEAHAALRGRGDSPVCRFESTPAWATGELEEMLLDTAGQHFGDDPLARDDLVAAREALLRTGWLDAVEQVRRMHGGVVEIRARFAEPFAVIRDRDGDHVVDPRGRLLPRTYPAGQAGPLMTITGVSADRPGHPGLQWEGADVAAALRLLEVIATRPWRGQVAAIDLSPQAGPPTLRLLTDRGCAIIWGRAPGDESAGEVPAERKVSYLDYHHEQYGHIDRGFSRELDIRGDVVIGR